MKRALYVVLSLVLVINLCSVYSFADGTDTEEKILNSFTEFINKESNLNQDADLQLNGNEEKSSPCMATINDDFKGGEVLVTIMREQSAARQEYTSADFPGLDIEDISVSMNYFPDINNNIVLLIKLNKQDKPSVLEAIKVLEQNPIVWSACPNYRLEFVDSVIIG